MILRLSQKLSTQIQGQALDGLPPDPNPFADWSANLFTAERTQFIIVTNTPSLYSDGALRPGIADDGQLIERVLEANREDMWPTGWSSSFAIIARSGTVQFSKA